MNILGLVFSSANGSFTPTESRKDQRTRKHSSRMRTARFSSWVGGGALALATGKKMQRNLFAVNGSLLNNFLKILLMILVETHLSNITELVARNRVCMYFVVDLFLN